MIERDSEGFLVLTTGYIRCSEIGLVPFLVSVQLATDKALGHIFQVKLTPRSM